MKTKIEISGYEIEIELHEDSISIKAEKDDEVVEEMSLPLSSEMEDDEMEEDEDDIKSFKNFEDEDEDDMEESEEDDEMEEEEDFEELPLEDEMEEDGKLESFRSYLNRTRKSIKTPSVASKSSRLRGK